MPSEELKQAGMRAAQRREEGQEGREAECGGTVGVRGFILRALGGNGGLAAGGKGATVYVFLKEWSLCQCGEQVGGGAREGMRGRPGGIALQTPKVGSIMPRDKEKKWTVQES